MAADTLSRPQPLEWHDTYLPHGAEAGPQARKALREALGPDGEALAVHLLDDTLIVAGELVINAVDHGSASLIGTIRLSWATTSTHVYLRVTDSGYTPDFVTHFVSDDDHDALRGRGLFMVDAISDHWEVWGDPMTHTTTVTTQLRIP